MTITSALQSELDQRPPKPFRGIWVTLIAGLMNHPFVLRLIFQYVLPALSPLLDRVAIFFVSSHRDVREILDRDDDFPVGPQVGPAMVCGMFVLGTDRGLLFREDLAVLWETFYKFSPKDPLPPAGPVDASIHASTKVELPPTANPLIKSITARVNSAIVAAGRKDGRLDLVQDVLRPECSRIVQAYLGVGPADDRWIADLWEVLESLALQIILPSGNKKIVCPSGKEKDDTQDPVFARVCWARATLRRAIEEGIDAAIATGAAGQLDPPNIIAKMYSVLATSNSSSDPEIIRETIIRNISGLAITTCHPIAKAAAHAVHVLLSNPPAFRGATAAAVTGNKHLFWDFIEEALRFFPVFPIVVRACPRGTMIGVDSDDPRKVRPGQKVTIGLLPAMFDSAAVPFPHQYRTDRGANDFLVFGYGMHACFGYQFARTMLVALLMPLFVCGFARAPWPKSKLKFDLVVPRSFQLRMSPPTQSDESNADVPCAIIN
jgi:cytochrome P450